MADYVCYKHLADTESAWFTTFNIHPTISVVDESRCEYCGYEGVDEDENCHETIWRVGF